MFSFAYYGMAYYRLVEENVLFRRLPSEVGRTSVVMVDETEGGLDLPKPILIGDVSLEEALYARRSKREFVSKSIHITQLSQILWAAQGITETTWGLRTAPSAGGTYPLDLIVVIGDGGVQNLEAGVFRYEASRHRLTRLASGDYRKELARASLSQPWVEKAPIVIVILATYERTTGRYGERGYRYVHLEAGHAAQNLLLEVTAQGLGAVPVGAFGDDEVKRVLQIKSDAIPLYVIPVGYPA